MPIQEAAEDTDDVKKMELEPEVALPRVDRWLSRSGLSPSPSPSLALSLSRKKKKKHPHGHMHINTEQQSFCTANISFAVI